MKLAASAGLILDPWQELVLDVMLRERGDGKWAAREVGYLVARQNGKGGVLDALCLAALFLFDDEREILFSAHEFKTAKKAYRSVKSLIQGAEHLHSLVERRGTRVVGFRQSNEDTSITVDLPGIGQKVLRFMARSNNTGRGFSSQRLIVDEAQECSEETRQALLYIVSAQSNPQTVFTGTVPGPKNNGEVFESLRDRGRAGNDPTLAWMEWTPEDGVDPESDEAVIASNPGMPYRISTETVAAERTAATTAEARAGYARERCSFWPSDSGTKGDIDMDRWAALDHQENDRPTPVAFTITVSQDREWSHICLAGKRSDGHTHLQVVQSARGTDWVPDRMAELVAAWSPLRTMLDGASPEGGLIDRLHDAGVDIELATGREVQQACGAIEDGIKHSTIRHANQAQLNLAARVAGKKPVGSTFVWRSNDPTVDIAPLRGVTLALHALSKPGKAPRKGTVYLT